VAAAVTPRERKLASDYSDRVAAIMGGLPSLVSLRERVFGSRKPLTPRAAHAFLRRHRADRLQAAGWLEYRDPRGLPDSVPVKRDSPLDVLRQACNEFKRLVPLTPWLAIEPDAADAWAWLVLTGESPRIPAVNASRRFGDVAVVTLRVLGFVSRDTVARAYSRAVGRRVGRPESSHTSAVVALVNREAAAHSGKRLSWPTLAATWNREHPRQRLDYRAMRRAFVRATKRRRPRKRHSAGR
jgi:hypothetical protein